MRIFIFIFVIITFVGLMSQDNELIERDRSRWSENYIDITPKDTAFDWFLPFNTPNRKDIHSIITVSKFGSPRSSYYAGHKHTGLDCMPRNAKEPVYVYAMAAGVVCSIHLGDQFKTIVIRHLLPDGSSIYTSYKHLGDIYAANGQFVDQTTRLARVLTKSEAKKYRGSYDHLHLEIRKNFTDFGCASWLTMTKQELNTRFIDPIKFIREKVR